jgi:hypothetical protein
MAQPGQLLTSPRQAWKPNLIHPIAVIVIINRTRTLAKPMHDGTGDNTGNIFPACGNGAPAVALFTLLVKATTMASLIHRHGLEKN